jgi:integrase
MRDAGVDLASMRRLDEARRRRPIPIGARLGAELEMRQHGPDGTAFGLEAFVFGNKVGEKINSVKTAWAGTCRRAGISGLQIRDVRREFASRLRESGASDHDVRDFLGHANITTTSRYLASTPLRLEQALANLEAGNCRTSVAQKADLAGQKSESLDSHPVAKSFKLSWLQWSRRADSNR